MNFVTVMKNYSNRNNSPSQQRKFPMGRTTFLKFNGREENPAECEVELTTTPSIDDGNIGANRFFSCIHLYVSTKGMSFLISATYESSTASFMGALSGGLHSILDLFSLR
ncbi:hypothetical protein L6452_01915 [Arctium lappa]|uniref:Uncharacterized protein n=1 Tax=Arctium lappa TaxID=4217 RepID=A0ACB9FJ97_ARCLA|nr:hypothetical protein L6452_01915 [Arctium lappa]